MSKARRWLWFTAGAAVVAASFSACGGLKDGQIIVVDDSGTPIGGSDGVGGGSGGTPSSGGSGGSAGGGTGGIVISDEPPTVVAVTPIDAATDVEPTTTVTIEFSESLDPATVTAANISVSDGIRVVPGQLGFGGVTATLTFDTRLDLLATHTLTVGTGITDLGGTALENEFSSSFTVREGVWGNEIQISNATGPLAGEAFPHPVMDARGNTLVVWTQSPEDPSGGFLPSIVWGRFYDPLQGWGETFSVSDGVAGASRPSLAMSADGDAVVAWAQEDGTFDRVYARRYIDGAWEPAGLRIDIGDISGIDRTAASITVDGDYHVLWSYTTTFSSVAGNHAIGSGAWVATTTYIDGSWDQVSGPSIAFDPDGNGFAIWAGVSGSNMPEVHVARYAASLENWDNGNVLTGSSGASTPYYDAPQIIADDAGGAMAAWATPDGIFASRFTKAGGWTPVAPVGGTGTIGEWSHRLARDGDDFLVTWHQQIADINNILSSRFTADAWTAPPDLLSTGDTSIDSWSEVGFGTDRHGNGIAVWTQGSLAGIRVRSARLIGETGAWIPDDAAAPPVDGIADNTVLESRLGVAPNGMAAAMYGVGYYYFQRDVFHASIFQ